jgi:hypothetical protein
MNQPKEGPKQNTPEERSSQKTQKFSPNRNVNEESALMTQTTLFCVCERPLPAIFWLEAVEI